MSEDKSKLLGSIKSNILIFTVFSVSFIKPNGSIATTFLPNDLLCLAVT